MSTSAATTSSPSAMAGVARGLPGVLELPCTAMRLPNGHTLIVDAGDDIRAGSEVIEVDARGQIVWNYVGEKPGSLSFAHSAVRLPNGNTLIADTTNDRVIEVTPEKALVFSTDQLGQGTGMLSDGTHLSYPNNATVLEDGTFLVTDRNNDRCLVLDREGTVHWQYRGGIKHPHGAERLPSGHVLVADSDGNRILEISREGEVAWSYGDGSPERLSWPRHARRLENGNTLITDSKNSRVIEVTPEGETVWSYQVDYFSKFYYSEPLENGNVLISDQQGHRVIEVDRAGTVVWQFRNYIYPNPIHRRLSNGSFKNRDAAGDPEDWLLVRRFSEGGGSLIWDEEARPRPAPGLCYDRWGALCLQQTIAVTPGVVYHMAGQVRTELADGYACLQLSFVDAMGAAIYDAPATPRGQTFKGANGWTPDRFEAKAPAGATACEVRLFLTGSGKAWVKGLLVHA